MVHLKCNVFYVSELYKSQNEFQVFIINILNCSLWSPFLKKIIFNRIIALQYCVSFCHPSTWISHNYTYICFLLNLPLTSNSNPTLVGSHRAPGWAPYGIHQPPTSHLFYKKSTTTNTRQDMEKREHFCTVGENVNWCNHYGEQHEDYFKN